MAKGRSLHVGVNLALPDFDVRPLTGCKGDAEKMHKIAKDRGFQAVTFVDGQATLEAVKNEILDAAGELKAGDIFLFTFAGHGSFNGTTDPEDNFQDEMILLHNCLLSDNYLRRNLWSQFAEGVRLLGIADCCHSGSVFVSAFPSPHPMGMGSAVPAGGGWAAPIAGPAVNARLRARTRDAKEAIESNRGITVSDRDRILEVNPEIHKVLTEELLSPPESLLKASLLTLAACHDHELAKDGLENGVFTERLLAVWDDGKFPNNYEAFIEAIRAPFLGSNQHPNMRSEAAGDKFLKQIPFTIDPGE